MQAANNSNEWVNWIEESISQKHIKYYEFEHFSDVQEIGIGSFGKVYRANWKNSHKDFALKSFYSFDDATVKEIIHEVIVISYHVYFYPLQYTPFIIYNDRLNFNVKSIFMIISFASMALQLPIKVR